MLTSTQSTVPDFHHISEDIFAIGGHPFSADELSTKFGCRSVASDKSLECCGQCAQKCSMILGLTPSNDF